MRMSPTERTQYISLAYQLCWKIAPKFANRRHRVEDLVHDGVVSLIRLIDAGNIKLERGNPVGYLSLCARTHISRAAGRGGVIDYPHVNKTSLRQRKHGNSKAHRGRKTTLGDKKRCKKIRSLDMHLAGNTSSSAPYARRETLGASVPDWRLTDREIENARRGP
jgi:hypothetical protein